MAPAGAAFRGTFPVDPRGGRVGVLKILVVDDDAASRCLFRYVLEEAGLEVSVVRDLEEAVAATRTFEPDVVASDYMLDGEATGVDVIEAVSHVRPTIGALLISGMPREYFEQYGNRLPAGIGFLDKDDVLTGLVPAVRALAGARPVEPAKISRVLVIEDQDRDRYLLSRLLEMASVEVIAVSGPAEAVEAARRFKVDAVIADLFLGGGGDGIDAVRAVRAVDASIPALLVSAMPDEYVSVVRARLPGVPFLSKSQLDRLVPAMRSRAGPGTAPSVP